MKLIFIALTILLFQSSTAMAIDDSSSKVFDDSLIVCRSDLILNSVYDNELQILVAAHRGAHDIVPENSLPSIHRALELGVDIIELDIRLSKDNIPILMHDKSLDRTTNAVGLISDYTFKELREFRLLKNGEVTEHVIPTLAEALALTKDRLVVDIDLKTDKVEFVVDVVKTSQAQKHIMFFNSKLQVLANLRKLLPSAVIMPLASNANEAKYFAKNFGIEIVHLKDSFSSSSLTNYIRDNNSASWLNTLGKVDTFLAQGSRSALDIIVKKRVDILQTDQPKLVLDVLTEKGLRPNFLGLSTTAPCGLIGN